MSTRRTIVLKGDPLQKEAVASEAITPGHLVDINSSGELKKHDTAGGNVIAAFAIEDALQGNEVGDDYSADNQAQYVLPRKGDEIQAWLQNGQDVDIGDPLESAGDGTLRKHTPAVESSSYTGTDYNNPIVGRALEALNLTSSSSSEDTRIMVEIL